MAGPYGKLKADKLVWWNSALDGNGVVIGDVENTLETIANKASLTGATFTGDINGNLVGDVTGDVTGNVTGNAGTATVLQTARNIGGVSFNGSAAINLPGVNATGNQNTSGNAATATTAGTLTTARSIGGVLFDGSADINLPGVDAAGTQNTTGSAATVTGAAQTAITSVGVLTGLTTSGDIAAVDLTLSGDLTVNGTTTTIDTTNLVVEDSLISLAKDNAANTLDIGIYGTYVDNATSEYTGLFRDQTDSKWRLFDSLTVAPGDTVDTTDASYAAATLVVGTLEDSKGDVRKIPENAKTTNYTLIATDAGKHIKFTPGDANQALTVPDSVFSAGDAVTIVNNSANNLAITKGTHMYNAADATDVSRTLAGRGMATLLFTAADTCYISGAGLS